MKNFVTSLGGDRQHRKPANIVLVIQVNSHSQRLSIVYSAFIAFIFIFIITYRVHNINVNIEWQRRMQNLVSENPLHLRKRISEFNDSANDICIRKYVNEEAYRDS